MAVLTEITNSDKDLLLDGNCTIKTKVIISDNKISGAIQEMKYDEENNYYYLNGESYQETSTRSVNYCPGIDKWSLSNGAYIENGYIVFPKADAKAISPFIPIDKQQYFWYAYAKVYTEVENNKLLCNTEYYDDNKKRLGGNGNASLIKNVSVDDDYNWKFGGESATQYGQALYNAKYIQLVFVYNTTYTKGTYKIKEPMISSERQESFIPYEPDVPSPDYPSPISTINGQLQAVIPYSTGNKLLSIDLGNNELCSLPNGVVDELIMDGDTLKITKRIGKVILNGSENWTASNKTYFTQFKDKKSNKIFGDNNLISDYFKQTPQMTSTTILSIGEMTESYYSSGNLNVFFNYDNGIGGVDNFKTWLSTHNTTVYCELSTPTEILLSNYSIQDTIILTEKDSVKDWTIDDERYVPDVGFFGQFTAKELSGNLQNITDDFNIENKYVNIQMGISTFQGSTTDWYSRGTYIISKPNDDEVSDNTKYTGYDLTILFNIPFNANYTDENFPKSFNDLLSEETYVTMGWLAKYVCAQVGVKFGTTSFINDNFKILSNQFTSGESCRDIMKYISELAFGYCEVNWDDICYIRTLITNYTTFDKYHKLDYDQYYSLETQKNSYGPVNRVFCGLQDVEGQGAELTDKNTTSSYTTTINIYNNPLTMGTTLEISEQLRKEAIQLCNVLWGIQYRPITKMETIGHPWLKAYEPIEVSDMELNKIITYPFTNTLKYTGHIKSDISSEGETKTEDTYGYKDSIERKMNRIGINVDRANKEITIINQEITKIGDDITDIKGNMLTIGDVYTKSEIRDIVSGVGVDGTVVTSLETATTIFDINGMTVGRTDAQTKTNVNANGMIITDNTNNTKLLNINNTGVYSENLTARTYLNFSTYGRFEKYDDNGTTRLGCFWIEGGE